MAWINFNLETKKWDRLSKDDEKPNTAFEISDLRMIYLDQIRKDLLNDLDHLEIIFGGVGSGKSTLARLDVRYVSNEKFNPRTHVVRTVDDIENIFTNAKKGEGVIIDEGSGIFGATDTMTKKTKYANYILDVCRQKNLLIIICCPALHRLTSSVAIDRATTSTRVYIDTRTNKRGRFAFYGKRAKEKLYRFAKANYGSLKGVRPKYRGRFSDDTTFKDEYLKMKDETLKSALASFNNKKDEIKAPTPQETIQQYKVDLVRKHLDTSVEDMAVMLDVSERTIERYRATARLQMTAENEILQNRKTENQLNQVTADCQT
jgi:uncharacterized protein YnzC (UPF0291/DUF896 family)/DNA-binding transcriptional regulator YiaG